MTCFSSLFRQRRLIWHLTQQEFRLRYAGSRLGVVWLLLGQVAVLGSYLIVFKGILQIDASSGNLGMNYGFTVACGLLPWLGFSEGITAGTASVLSHRNLMKGQVFPTEIIPVTAVCSALIGQLIGTVIMMLALGTQGYLGVSSLFIPALIAIQGMITLGAVWILSCVNILFRDLSQVVRLAILLLMILSPIAYTSQMVPAKLDLAVKLNPLAYLIEGYRDLLLFDRLPNMWSIVVLLCIGVVLLQIGHHYFLRVRKILPDYL